MRSIEELENYLESEFYSFAEISIGKHHASQGFVFGKDYLKLSEFAKKYCR